MTKAQMIETLVTDAVEKWNTVVFYDNLLGEENKKVKAYSREWSQAFTMLEDMGLMDQYFDKLRELKNERLAKAEGQA